MINPELSAMEWMALGTQLSEIIGIDTFLSIGSDVLGPERVRDALEGNRIDVSKKETAALILQFAKFVNINQVLGLAIGVLGEQKVRDIIAYLIASMQPEPVSPSAPAPVDERPAPKPPADYTEPGGREPDFSTLTDRPDGEFLWKPVSESDGKLVVLLPNYHGIVKVTLGRGSAIYETGKYRGIGNGNRRHYRFAKPGDQYPQGTQVTAWYNQGYIQSWTIFEVWRRTENIMPELLKLPEGFRI